MSQQIDPKHADTRATLRFIGPLVVLAGVVFALIGFGSFFSSFGSFEPPRYFWCAFIGLPLIALGVGICKFAFLGAITRYMANEVAPVGKDAVNYLAGETKGAVREFASAVGEGLRGSGNQVRVTRCHKCNADNELPANFCKGCGASLAKTKPCAACNELNDADARFCDNCGKPVGYRAETTMKKAFDHIGIPTLEPQPGESWVEFSNVWVTNPRLHPQRIEYIRPLHRPDVPREPVGMWKLWHWPHVAYRVDNLQEALAGEELVYGPFDPGGFGQVAFVLKDGIVVEYMEYTDLGHWFGQPNPPGWEPEPW